MHGSTGIEGASPLHLIDIDCSVVNLDARVNALRESTVPRFARGLRFDLEVDTSIIIADIFRAARDDRILALLRPHGRYWDPVAEITVRCAVTGRTLPATHIMANDIRGPEWLVFDAPETVSSLEIAIGGLHAYRAVQPNLSRLFADRRVLLTLCRDEPMQRIMDWAHWHADRHDFDAVLYYDNGSTIHTRQDVAAALATVPGIEAVAAVAWPWTAWPAVRRFVWSTDEAWSQNGSIRHAVQRFLQSADLVMCADVDELLVSFADGPEDVIGHLLANEDVDAIVLQSQNVVAVDPTLPDMRHRDLHVFGSDMTSRHKWIARPRRLGPDRLSTQHDPCAVTSTVADPDMARIAHFLPLTTGWGGRHPRLRPTPADPAFADDSLRLRRQLDDVFDRWTWAETPSPSPSLDQLTREAWIAIEAGDHATALARLDAALARDLRQPTLAAARRTVLDLLPPEMDITP